MVSPAGPYAARTAMAEISVPRLAEGLGLAEKAVRPRLHTCDFPFRRKRRTRASGWRCQGVVGAPSSMTSPQAGSGCGAT
jgi:hypothetical protein